MDDDQKFLVPLRSILDRSSFIGMLIFMSLPFEDDPEMERRIMEKYEARGGKMDVRILIEGEEFTFSPLDKELVNQYDRICEQAAQQILKEKLSELDDQLRNFTERFSDLIDKTSRELGFEVWRGDE